MITLVCKKRKQAQEQDTLTILSGETTVVMRAWEYAVLPHELVHAAVEVVFGLRGFIRLAAAGLDSETIIAERDPDALRAENLTNAYQYELAGMAEATDTSFRALLNAFDARGEAPHEPEAERIAEGRELLADLGRRWAALPPGASWS